MYGLDNASGVNVMPPIAPKTSQSPLWFTEGDNHQQATYPGQDWFNEVQSELLNVLTEAGIAPDKTKLNQLSTAINTLIGKGALLTKNHLSEIATAGASAQRAARNNLNILGQLIGIQQFTASGTYTPNAGVRFVIVEICGGGGSGGGAQANAAGYVSVGGGGGGGCYAKFYLANFASPVNVVIGAGGAGVVGGAGKQGGNSSFGGYCTVYGGTYGTQWSANSSSMIAPGGTQQAVFGTGAGIGLLNSDCGGTGGVGILTAMGIKGGAGGSSFFGSGPSGTGVNGAAYSASTFGCGGGGSSSNSTTAPLSGAGGAGVCIVWEYT